MKQVLIVILFFLFNEVSSQTNKLEGCYQKLIIKMKIKGKGRYHSGTLINIYDKKGFLLNDYTNENFVTFSFDLKCGEEYRIEAFNNYYIIEEKNYTPSFDLEQNTIWLNVKINPRFNAHFNFSSASPIYKILYYKGKEFKLSRESKIKLNSIVHYLHSKNFNKKIVIESHTDSNGSDKSNLKLSKRRLKEVTSYLKKIGVLDNPIITTPLGESMLTNRCSDGVKCSKREHKQNNRTTFRYISN